MYTLWWRGSAIEVERPLVAQSGQPAGNRRRTAKRTIAAKGATALRCRGRSGIAVRQTLWGFGTGGLSLRRVDRLFEKAVDGLTSWFDRSR
jgi:hypothetical protein